jgi:uncharacterized protein YqjF (DUF2071 family)
VLELHAGGQDRSAVRLPTPAAILAAGELLAGRLSHDAARQGAATRVTAHRGLPLPGRPWAMGQTWTDLLFAHWPVEPAHMRRLVPAQLPLDVRDGRAWLGITPFEVRGLRPRGAPPPGPLARFPELNVRTYVDLDGMPGIWFFSLDAGSRAAVATARLTYRLPYFPARMRVVRSGGWIGYESERRGDGDQPALHARYRPTGAATRAAPGSVEHWLTERYRLYAADRRGRVWRGDIHHTQWPLQPAEADIACDPMAAPLGLPCDGPPLLHFACRQDVVVWRLERVR